MQFATAAWVLSKHLRVSHRHPPFFVRDIFELPPDKPYVNVEISSDLQTQGDVVKGDITAQILPGGESEICVFVVDHLWPKLEPWWNLLRAELERQRWIDPEPIAPVEVVQKVERAENAPSVWMATDAYIQAVREVCYVWQRNSLLQVDARWSDWGSTHTAPLYVKTFRIPSAQ